MVVSQMRIQRRRFVPLMAGLIGLSVISIAFDSEAGYDTYAGVKCRFFGVQSDGGALKYMHDRLENGSTSADLPVTCPIRNHSGSAADRPAFVAYTSASSAWSIQSCNVFWIAFDGASFVTLPSPVLEQSGSSIYWLWNKPFAKSYQFGPIALACIVPPREAIFDYYQGV